MRRDGLVQGMLPDEPASIHPLTKMHENPECKDSDISERIFVSGNVGDSKTS